MTANLKSWRISPAVYILTAFSLLNTWSYQLVAAARRIAARLPPKTGPEPTHKLERRARYVPYSVLQIAKKDGCGQTRSSTLPAQISKVEESFGNGREGCSIRGIATPSMDPEHPIRRTSPPHHKTSQTACRYIFIASTEQAPLTMDPVPPQFACLSGIISSY